MTIKASELNKLITDNQNKRTKEITDIEIKKIQESIDNLIVMSSTQTLAKYVLNFKIKLDFQPTEETKQYFINLGYKFERITNCRNDPADVYLVF